MRSLQGRPSSSRSPSTTERQGDQPPHPVLGLIGQDVTAIQRTAGNAAANRLVAQRMLRQPQITSRDTTEPLDTTEADLRIVRDYRAETQDPHVQGLLDELLPHLGRVTAITQRPGQAFTRNRGNGSYTIEYEDSTPGPGSPDHVAVLVHELTHVLVNESYQSDMLNFPVPPLDMDVAEDRAAAAGGEEARQDARRAKRPKAERERFIDIVLEKTNTLLSHLRDSGLSAERQRLIEEKLRSHTQPKPFHEYDAVLAHILTWCDKDGIDRSTAFYRTLTEMVRETAGWRAEGDIPLGPAATSAAPATGAAGPADGRKRDKLLGVLRKMGRK